MEARTHAHRSGALGVVGAFFFALITKTVTWEVIHK
jgi:TRAP-type mannitol/chloroaromatic compound transport system permease large subunit